MRTDVQIPSGAEHLAAWLYRPEDAAADVPCVVMAHGFAAIKEQRLDAYAERFCQAGMACVVFDYRHFGASPGQPRQLLSIKRQLEDWRAAIAYARGLDGVDDGRIALWGSSFSGGHVTALAADGERVAAVVAQAPYGDGLATLPALGLPAVLKGTVAGLRDLAGAVRGREPHYVSAGGRRGSDALLQMPSALGGYTKITPAGVAWDNRVAARIALQIALYRPSTKAARVACPILFCLCDEDDVTPIAPMLKAAAAAPRSELVRYPLGHFDIYLGAPWERAVADQTAFLCRHLGLAEGPGATERREPPAVAAS